MIDNFVILQPTAKFFFYSLEKTKKQIMRYTLLGLMLLFGGMNMLSAQKFLQLEKVGSFKVKRFYAGDEVTFQLHEDDTWYSEEISELLVDDGMVLFSNRVVAIKDIRAIKSFAMQRWSKPLSNQMFNFTIGWTVFSLGGTLAGWKLNTGTIVIPVTALLTGFLIRKIFHHRTWRIGNHRRLRLLDLTFHPLTNTPVP